MEATRGETGGESSQGVELAQKRRGRPKGKGNTRHIQARLSTVEAEKISRFAERMGLTESDVVRELIRRGMQFDKMDKRMADMERRLHNLADRLNENFMRVFVGFGDEVAKRVVERVRQSRS